MDEGWKKDLSTNFSIIVKHVDDPDAVAEYLHYDCNPPVFTEEDVQWMKALDESTKNKTRKLLHKLTFKPNYPLVALYNAFKESGNTALRKCLVPHVESYYKAQKKDISKPIPDNKLPMTDQTWKEFHQVDAVTCQIDSAGLLKTYEDTNHNYKMTKETRGRAVIINNANFEEQKKRRHGSEKDVELLKKTLTQLHFDVKVYEDLTAVDIRKTLSEESQSDDLKSAECFILVVMSHGVISGINGTKDEVVKFDEFAKIFNPTKCTALKDKPKLFFFQSCRQKGEQGMDTSMEQRGRIQGVENNKDFLFSFATVEGFQSMCFDDTGAWFIQALCWVLKYDAHRLHILDMLTKVNALVSGMEEEGKSCYFVPECRGSLVKNVYFFPGVRGEPSSPLKNEKNGAVL
ncbi:caspase-3-like [Mizuhopecten yessoensis]|nr:caspase-3-like [Mizuhopecten yessoensis]